MQCSRQNSFRYDTGIDAFYLLRKSCSLGQLYVLHVICLFEILGISHFGSEGKKLILIVLGLGHCLTFTFEICLNSGRF